MAASLRVLILEDRESDAELNLAHLRRAGYEPQWERVDNEADYLTRLNGDLDLILADYTMPQFNALRALQLLRERDLDIPFIVITGTVSEQAAVDCIGLGAADYLLKDRLARLGPAVAHALREKTLREEKRAAEEALQLYLAELEQLVTERTADLQRAKERAEAILNHSSDAIVLLSPNGLIQQVNAAFYQQFGYAVDELFQQPLVALASAESAAALREAVREVLEGRQPRRIEMDAQRKDETHFTADVALSPIRESGEVLSGILCSLRDISERKRTEEALREGEFRYRLLFENAAYAIFVMDDEGRCLDVNHQAEVLTGYSRAELLSMRLSRLRSPEHAEQTSLLFREFLRLGNLSGEYMLRRKDGTVVSIEFSASRIAPDRGQVSVRDISERRQAEALMVRMSTSALLLREVAVAANEATEIEEAFQIAVDAVCNYTRWPVGHVYLGEGDNLLPMNVWYLEDDKRFARFRQATEQTVFERGTGSLVGWVFAYGQPRWVTDVNDDSAFMRPTDVIGGRLRAAFAFPVLMGDETVAVLEFFATEALEQDDQLLDLLTHVGSQLSRVVERKRTEADLRRAFEKEKELSELKSRFTSTISHEFRTPLATIQMASDLLKHYSERMDEQSKREHLDKIQVQVRRLTDMMDDILTISKAETVGLTFKPQEVNLERFCRDLAEEMQLAAGETHHIAFSASGPAPTGLLDPELLRQAVVNLLSNAVKYSPEGRTVHFELESAENRATIRVRDEGIGIPEEDQKRLFETFFRAGNVGSIQGTGLGLAIVKRAVEIHGGTVECQSQVGIGTTFTIRLPLVARAK